MAKAGLEPWVPPTSDQTGLWEGPCGRKEVQTGGGGGDEAGSQASLLVQEGGESGDVYDCFLTQAEIQGNINHVNGERSGPRGLGVLSG